MSPKYEVYISKLRAQEFEQFVITVGGRIENRMLSRQDAEQEWMRQSQIAQNLLKMSQQEQDPNISRQIINGAVELVNSCIQDTVRTLALKPGTTPTQIYGAIMVFFSDSVEGKLPVSCYPVPTKSGMVLKRSYKPDYLSPAEVIYLIEKFGISNGKKKSDRLTMGAYQTHHQSVNFRIKSAVRNYLVKSELIPVPFNSH